MNLRVWYAAAAVLLLASCSQGTQGIFASIEHEQKVKSAGGLSTVATVSHLAELDSRYYIAGGGYLFQRANNEVKWRGSTITAGGKTYKHVMAVSRVGAVTSAGGGILYAIANQDSTATNQLLSSVDGTTWLADTTTVPAGFSPASLVPIHNNDGFSVDKMLLTVVDTTDPGEGTYQHVYLFVDNTGTSTDIDLGYGYGFPITGAAADGTDYYFANNDAVLYYNGTTATQVTGSPSDEVISSSGFYDVLVLPASAPGLFSSLAVVSGDKGLYWGTLAAGAWTQIGKKLNVHDDLGGDVAFGPMIYQDQTSTAVKYVWIGTLNSTLATGTYQGAGIASLASDDLATPNPAPQLQPPEGTDKNNFKSTVLVGSQIWSLTRTSDDKYYAGTGAQGLWNWKVTSLIWSQE